MTRLGELSVHEDSDKGEREGRLGERVLDIQSLKKCLARLLWSCRVTAAIRRFLYFTGMKLSVPAELGHCLEAAYEKLSLGRNAMMDCRAQKLDIWSFKLPRFGYLAAAFS